MAANLDAAAMRRALQLALGQEDDGVYRPDPGALASVGVRKVDPSAMRQPLGYRPVLPEVPAQLGPVREGPSTLPYPTRSLTPEEARLSEARAKAGSAQIPGRAMPEPMPPPVIGPSSAPPAPRSRQPAGDAFSYSGNLERLAAEARDVRAPAGDGGGPPSLLAKLVMGAAPGAVPQATSGGDEPMRNAEIMRALGTAGANLTRSGQRAGSNLVSALTDGRVRAGGADEAGYAQRLAAAEAPVQGVLAERARAIQERERARKLALEDPASPESRRAQEMLRAMFPKVAAQLGPNLERLPASQADEVTKMAEFAVRQQEVSAGREDQQSFQAQQNELSRQNARAVASLAAGNRADVRADAAQKDLAEDMVKAGVPGFYQQYGEAATVMNDPANAKDLPGVGYLGGLAPDWMVGEQGRTLRQAVGQMLAEYRKGVTGAGMSDSERAEYGQITGLLQKGDEGSFRQGVERLRRATDARVQARAAGSPADVVERYGQRAPFMREALRGGATAGPTASGTVRVSNGQETLDIPAADVAEAERDGFRRVQ